MKKLLLITSALILSLMVATTAKAQDTGVNSPFSRYGIGLLSNQNQGFNQGMAGLAYGMYNGREINFKNPASYSAIDSLTFLFDLGVSAQNGNFDAGETSVNARNASFDHLTMAYRLHRGLGMSLGLMPISNIGYKMSSIGNTLDGGIAGDVTPTTSYRGQGGLRELYAGIGYAPIKELSFGVNVGYVWGVMTHVITNPFTDSNVDSNHRAYSNDIRTYTMDAGLQWRQKVNKSNTFTLGLAYTLGHDINGKSYFYNQRINSSTVLAADTLVAHNAWSLPQTFGGGLSWQWKNSLRIGVDYKYEQWSECKQPVLESQNGTLQYVGRKTNYSDTHRYTIGAEYVKDPTGLNWASRVRYRAGFSFGNSYTNVYGKTGPKSYLASIGAALPIINLYNNRTFVNVAAQYECIKPQVPGQVKETYLRLCLGITFNERWFQKWKVE